MAINFRERDVRRGGSKERGKKQREMASRERSEIYVSENSGEGRFELVTARAVVLSKWALSLPFEVNEDKMGALIIFLFLERRGCPPSPGFYLSRRRERVMRSSARARVNYSRLTRETHALLLR